MALGEAELLRIGEYVKGNLKDWVQEVLPPIAQAADPVSHTMLMERVVRVEEELKAQRELMQVRFDAADQRFVAVDQRFESLQTTMDQRFESLQTLMEQRFVAVDRRFVAVDQRFEDLLGFLDRRFTAVDKRFAVLQWGIGILAALVGTVLAFVIAL